MLNFCTLFNSAYLTRGLVMYRSLEDKCASFHLYVFAFDDTTFSYLRNNRAAYPHLTAISLAEFEDPELLAVRPQRSLAEYCWTCTPSTILYCINRFQLPHCTYIDADLYFYADPVVLIEEMGEQSVLISEHRYTKEYDQSTYSGIYCVQFMCFKNTPAGLQVLNWWRDRCIEWCYARSEDGKFGDQKYLDDWTTRFSGVHVLRHSGGGAAPWNIQQFDVSADLVLTEKNTGRQMPLIFFHFHGLKFFTDGWVSLCGSLYELTPSVKKLIYYPYVNRLLQMENAIRLQGLQTNITGATDTSPSKPAWLLRFLWEGINQIKNGKLPPYKLIFTNFINHYHIFKTKHGVPD